MTKVFKVSYYIFEDYGMITKRERFKKVAVQRTNKIINYVRLLGNCANKNNYEYSEADIKKIFSAIEKELKLSKSKFEENQGKGKFDL